MCLFLYVCVNYYISSSLTASPNSLEHCFKVSGHFNFFFLEIPSLDIALTLVPGPGRLSPLAPRSAPLLLFFSDLPEIETALPDIETALPEKETALPEIETALPEIETYLPEKENARNRDFIF